nr:amidohydrolase family protein [Cupriavidus basilensis]
MTVMTESSDLPTFDLLIRGGDLIDGTGAPRRAADIGIRDGLIAAIGDLSGTGARETIDATGLVVAPGFIDSHSHDDWMVFSSPAMAAKVTQGVTTVITGNCGISLFPLVTEETPPAPLNMMRGGYRFDSVGAYREAFAQQPAAVNVSVLIGQSTLRARHVADLQRAANDEEIAAMRDDVARAMREGAIGVSTGTFYPNGVARGARLPMPWCQAVRSTSSCTRTMSATSSATLTPWSAPTAFPTTKRRTLACGVHFRACSGCIRATSACSR